ncbi:hypothetical protein PV327_000057 [Microctonus hyperodae]|uniref:Uncharacterized protein n=1 Tax=Microctonus hyperodae TaxID=165561 RepID=A0AA39L1V7_MICHY|nr:hypothetical protein PV327_000057 [Microctonus hyperodae]
MPHNSRARKNRRNRNARLKHRTAKNDDHNNLENATASNKVEDENKSEHGDTENEVVSVNEQTMPPILDSASLTVTEDMKKSTEAKVDDQAVKVTMEVDSTSKPLIGSISEKRVPSWRKYKLERGALNTQTKICEITSVSGLALEASIGHIAGVGILETGLTTNNNINQCLDSVVTITEPMEPLKPLPSDVTSRVENLGGRNFALAVLPDNRVSNKNGPEIHEVTDNIDIEMTTMDSSRPAIIVEVESDVEFETPSRGNIKDVIVEETLYVNSDIHDIIDNQKSIVHKTEENEINFNTDENITKIETRINNCENLNNNKIENDNEERVIIGNMTNFVDKNNLIEKPARDDIKTRVENEFPISIQELELPNSHDNNLLNDFECVNNESSEQIINRRAANRALLNSYFSNERNTDHFLDIIQEESERFSGDEEQHIRDFINEEIGKFQREKRSAEVKCETEGIKIEEILPDTQENNFVNEKTKLNCQLDDITPNYCDEFVLENEVPHSFTELKSFVPLNYEKGEELNSVDNAQEVPPLPRRSSSFINKDIEPVQPHSSSTSTGDYSPPPVPPLPNQVDQFSCSYSCHQPKRPPLPNFNIAHKEQKSVNIKNTTSILYNDVNEADKIGNDEHDYNDDEDKNNDVEPPCLEIAHDHIDFGGTQKISEFCHSSACKSQCKVSPCLKSAAAAFVEYRRDTVRQSEVESSQSPRPNSSRVDENKKVAVEDEKVEKVEKRRPLETQKHKCIEGIIHEGEIVKSKNIDVKAKNEIKECITDISRVIQVEDKSCELFENNAGNSSESGCREFLQQFQTPEEYQKNESFKSQVVVENNQTSVLNESSEFAGASDADSRGGFADASSHDSPINCLDDKVYQNSFSTISPTSSCKVKNITQDTCDIDNLEQSPIKDLYYVPNDVDNIYDKTKSSLDIKPQTLKELCIKKIFSIPYGIKIINEISLSKFNISKNLQTIPRVIGSFESLVKEETADVNSTDKMMKKKERPKSWMGVPTSVNPRLLVCLSPSQQENDVRTSADRLLDLHEKFLNRRSYHEKNNSEYRERDINVPKYLVEVNSLKKSMDLVEKNERNECNQSNRVSAPSSNRLLTIIKENPISSDSPQVTNAHKNFRQDRLETERHSNWMTLERNERHRYENGDVEMKSTLSSIIRTNIDRAIINENPDDNYSNIKSDDDNFDQIIENNKMSINRWQNDTASRIKRINSALIIQSSSDNNMIAESSNITPMNKSSITQNSAIIDKSPSTPELPRKWMTQLSHGIIDSSRHVNPALINDKPETPPRTRRCVNVDRSCIDTTSIFDNAPPRSHLIPRKYHNPQALKQATASEIVKNLKCLETTEDNIKDKIDGKRRYSLPYEIFHRQLNYVEQLENQLKEVILAEEDEKKAFNELHNHLENKVTVNDEKITKVNENDEKNNYSENWYEESKIEDKDHTEFMKKEGHRDKTKCVVDVDGGRIERLTDIFENKEVKEKITTMTRWKNDENEMKTEWKKLFQDFSTEKLDENKKINRPNSISIFPTNNEIFRCQMYNEYIDKVLEREERKHHKVIKISSHMDLNGANDKNKSSSMNTIEKEFIERAKNRMNRFGINLDASESERTIMEETKSEEITRDVETTKREHNGDKAKCLIDGKEIKDAEKLPKHLQEFLVLATNDVVEDVQCSIDIVIESNK